MKKPCSLAIENSPGRPFNGFLVYGSDKAQSSYTVCDLNSESSPISPTQKNNTNHKRRNSVAIKFHDPRTNDKEE